MDLRFVDESCLVKSVAVSEGDGIDSEGAYAVFKF